jgi:hypothetical protein
VTNPLAILEVGAKLLDKIIPDPEQKAKAQLELLRLQQEGQFKEVEVQLQAILAEAGSADPWTSRARPSFLYVVYILLLFSLPMGLLSAVSPDTAGQVASGARGWLESIPTSLVDLFTYVMLGYIGGRSYEKVKGAAK